MLAEAAGLAVLAALSPTALLLAAIYLGSDRPRLTALLYLAGAVLMSVATAVLVLTVLRNLGLSRPAAATSRYGLRLGLGALLLAGCLVVAARHRGNGWPVGPGDGPCASARLGRPRPGIVSRMAATPAPSSAFAAGLLVFAPGVTFVAAIQVIATTEASLRLTVFATAVVVIINVMLVWQPVLAYLIVPEKTGRWLSVFNRWLRANGRAMLVGAMLVAGVVLVVNGIHGLAAT
jgi:Sap-like sulfolipid-1-addressing protein